MKKVLVRLFVVFCLVASFMLVAPFSLSAETTSGSARILGVNIYFRDNMKTGLGNYSVSMNSSGTSGSISYNGNYATNSYYLYEYEFVLDGTYAGSVTLSATNTLGATQNNTYYINGSSLILTSENLVTSFSITQNLRASGSHDPWQYPFESYAIIMGVMNQGFVPQYGYTQGGYIYPMFKFYAGNTFLNAYVNNSTDYYMVLLSNNNIWGLTPFNNNFDFGNLTVDQCYVLNQYPNINGSITYLYRVKFHNTYNGGGYFNFKVKQDIDVMPIFFGNQLNLLSTDFALNFGLTNRVLDILNGLNMGNENQQESANDLNEQTSDFGDASSDLISYEDDFNDSLNNSLDDINVNFDVGNTFGSKFLASATWVRQQYDALTSTTPFGTVLSFSLLLGLALLIIGKAIK